jgi:hypothetical protein
VRLRAKIDKNQPQITDALRRAGCSVWVTSMHRTGVDIVVGKNGRNFLFEVNDPDKPFNQRKLTDDEKAFHAAWLGQVTVIETAEEALKIVNS